MRNTLDQLPVFRNYIKSLRRIPGGTFDMGSITGDSDERPVHSVQISAFRLGTTPVTVAIWKEYCLATGDRMPEPPPWGWIDDHPMVNVSWIDVLGNEYGEGSFCSWASAKFGMRFRLPTEAQHEYALRAGQGGNEYPWGNTFDHSMVWSSKIGFGDASRTAPVSRASNIYINAFGLSDMCGNVRHLCSDSYVGYKSSTQVDPMSRHSPESNSAVCVRGGSWRSMNPDSFRNANRFAMIDSERDIYTGFRLAAGVP
jgi:formylglycine-generating enzyme required for sulfatase activity